MTDLWVAIGIVGMIVLLTILDRIFGRGHLGVEQSKSHYTDEIEVVMHSLY
ncbi:MAG TPA: hypothetical protein VF201_03435 [Nitrolancea sp.]